MKTCTKRVFSFLFLILGVLFVYKAGLQVISAEEPQQEDVATEPQTQIEQEETVVEPEEYSALENMRAAGDVQDVDVSSESELNAAIGQADPDVSVRVDQSFQINKTVEILSGTDVTIGSDKEVTLSMNKGNQYMFHVQKGASLTIDGSILFDAMSVSKHIKNEGTLILLNGTFANASRNSIETTGKDASFTMYGGYVQDMQSTDHYQGAITISNGANGSFYGGTLQNNTISGQYSGALLVYNADCVIHDIRITNNKNSNNGANYSSPGLMVAALATSTNPGPSSHVTMNGGMIDNNDSSYYAGGVMVYGGNPNRADKDSQAYFTMNGGTIRNNQSVYGGGGVFVYNGAHFTMEDGLIDGNETRGLGGGVGTFDSWTNFFGKTSYESQSGKTIYGIDADNWPNYFPAEFVMNGGTISNNWATAGGGGIYAGSSQVNLQAGYILDNGAGRYGGGVYIASVPYVARIKNAVVTENTAGYIGGGVWFCPTGEAVFVVNEGAALYGNTAEDAGDDFASAQFFFSSAEIDLSERTLGGGRNNWTRDGAILSGSEMGYVNEDVARYDPASEDNEYYPFIKAHGNYALKSLLNEEAGALANSLAKLFITGNYAYRGGGIGSNGGLIAGDPDKTTIQIEIEKTWISGNKDIPEDITVYLEADGYRIEEIHLNKDNQWKALLTGLPVNIDFQIVEKEIEGWKSSITKTVDGSGNQLVSVVNVIPHGSLRVEKTVVGNKADQSKDFMFRFTFDTDQSFAYHGSKTGFVTTGAIIALKHGQWIIIDEIPAGTKYVVEEVSADGYQVIMTNESGEIQADTETIVTVTNIKNEVEENHPLQDTASQGGSVSGVPTASFTHSDLYCVVLIFIMYFAYKVITELTLLKKS